MMVGPTGTPYERGAYNLELFLPEGYPMEPPKADEDTSYVESTYYWCLGENQQSETIHK